MTDRSRREPAPVRRSPSDSAQAGPLPAWVPPLFWLASSVVLVAVVLAVVPRPGPLDDPDSARQRPGVLTAPSDARRVGKLSLPGDSIGRRPVMIFFDRRPPNSEAFRRLERRLPAAIATVLVLGHGPRPAGYQAVAVDRHKRIADAVGMRTPKDGGPPVGYAIIDRQARVRYATLDPGYLRHSEEDATMAAAAA